MATIVDRCKAFPTWKACDEAGLLEPLIRETGWGTRKLAEKFGWSRSEWMRKRVQSIRGKAVMQYPVAQDTLKTEAQATNLQGDIQQDVYRRLVRDLDTQHSVLSLADAFDCSPRLIREALTGLADAGYNMHVSETDVVRLDKQATQVGRQYKDVPWGEASISIGVVSDSHCGNLCYCEEELQAAYDKFASEGVAFVVHCGDLMDGPANRGPRPAHECNPNAFTAHQAVLWTREHYPQRSGLKTYFIESAQSHAGWELKKTGQSMGHMLADGFRYFADGPRSDDMKWEPGRDDLEFLGYDEATLRIGPECNTRFLLRHPGGGTAYALSYNLQKWAEGLEGGTKPHICAMGHYHKFCHIMPRNIYTLSVDSACWQSPWMASRNIAAHVGFNIYEFRLDTDGTVREFQPRHFPFFFGEKRTFDLGMGAA